MATVLLDMVISLDGLICGPGGADGGLHDWYFNPSEVSRPIVDELVSTTGAIIVGRGAFGAGDAAGGWDDTPYQVPHFVVTHRPPQPAPRGMVEFIFVPDGVRAAVERAQEAAGDHYATIGGAPTLLGNVWPSAWWTRCSCTSYPFCSETGCPSSTAPVPDGA